LSSPWSSAQGLAKRCKPAFPGVFDLTNRVTTSWLLLTFGEGCPEVFVIQAFMQFSHFWGYRSNNFFNSMRWAEDTSLKVRKSPQSLILARASGPHSLHRSPHY